MIHDIQMKAKQMIAYKYCQNLGPTNSFTTTRLKQTSQYLTLDFAVKTVYYYTVPIQLLN